MCKFFIISELLNYIYGIIKKAKNREVIIIYEYGKHNKSK